MVEKTQRAAIGLTTASDWGTCLHLDGKRKKNQGAVLQDPRILKHISIYLHTQSSHSAWDQTGDSVLQGSKRVVELTA